MPWSEEDMAAEVIEFLRTLSSGTEIVWSDDTSGDEPVLTKNYLDVWSPLVARAVGLNWVWYIASPAEHDRDPGHDPEDASPHPLDLVVDYDAHGEDGTAGWTAAHVCEVLWEWVRVHVGRDDLRFRYDPTLMSDMIAELDRE